MIKKCFFFSFIINEVSNEWAPRLDVKICCMVMKFCFKHLITNADNIIEQQTKI